MIRNTVMKLITALLLGFGATGACSLPGAASARPMIDGARYVLHGTGRFRSSTASAIVTRLAVDQFRLSITAAHLPVPMILHVRLARHVYVAWLVDDALMHGPLRMAAVGLIATGAAGTYAGQGIVTISYVTSVIVTAEPTAQGSMPRMPILTVLGGAGYQI